MRFSALCRPIRHIFNESSLHVTTRWQPVASPAHCHWNSRRCKLHIPQQHEPSFQLHAISTLAQILSTIHSLYHFRKVEEARGDPKFEWSVESVLQIISSTAGQVRWNERLRQFQDLRCVVCMKLT